jgi:murein lipoprotein
MKSLITKSGIAGLSIALLLATGCASNARVDAVEAKADSAQKTADAAMAAANRAQQTADQALRAANDANAAITRLSETVGRK